jgi:hypothetical protein
MVLLHLCRRDGRYYLWGESAPAQPDGLSLYDVGASRLGGVLEHWLWAEPGICAEPLFLGLPTCGAPGAEQPVPSLPFLAEAAGRPVPDPAVPYPLKPWRVTAVGLTGKQLMTALNQARERRLDDGLFAGESLSLAAGLFRFTGSLVARGRFLPGAREAEGGRFEARWAAVLDGADLRALRGMAAGLPRFLLDGMGPEEAAESIVDDLTDALVRSSVVTTLSEAQAQRGRFYSAHDAWFAALRGSSGVIRWPDAGELHNLCGALSEWRYPVAWQRKADTALRFELSQPAGAGEPWPLRILIQGARDVRPFPADLGEASVTPDLLLALGQAAQLYPPLATAAAMQGGGYGCGLTSDEAYLFLTAAAGVLEGAGYAVSLPPGWQGQQARSVELVADAAPAEPGGTVHSLDEKMAVRWSVTLNGEKLTPEELAGLLRAPSPLVFFRGQWIVVDVRKLQDALRALNRKSEEDISAREIIRLALGVEGHNGLDVAFVRSGGWLNPFLRQLGGEESFEVLPPPEGFNGELRPYQVRGYSWLAFLRALGFGACLADDMGLGKTIQALAFLLHEKAKGERRPVLLAAPMSVLGNWMRETQRFAPGLRCMLHHGAGRWHGESFAREARGADFVLTSYALLPRDYMDLRKVEWAGIILDEAQNVKNPDTRQAQAARALKADYRIALTGTPMENHVGDVWSIMDFLNPGLLGKRGEFRKRFFQPIQSGTDPGARTRLRQMTMPFILRRLKTDKNIITDLPEKIENKVFCPLTLEQAKLYQEVLDTFDRELDSADGIGRRGLILAVLTKLKQVCNHPSNYLGESFARADRSGKLVRLEEMLDEVFAQGESALVFTQYAEMGHLLQRELCQRFAEDMPFLHGGVARKDRDKMVAEFQSSTNPCAFILSLKAGGTGLNLTRATHVFHFDRWWNPAVEDQATDRAFRIGQTRRVMVHKFICSGTLEDRIDQMIEQKTRLAAEIIRNGEKFLTELSNDALRDVLRLDSGGAFYDEGREA